MLDLATMMPDMDKEVALKVIEQFPEFRTLAVNMLDLMEQRHESSLRHNKDSQNKVHEAYRSVRAILEGELDRDLDWDQRKFILDKLMETADREFEKDSENKKFIETTFGKVLTGVGGVAVAAAFVLGGWSVARSSEDDQSK